MGVNLHPLDVRFGHFSMVGRGANSAAWFFSATAFSFFSECHSSGEGFTHGMSRPLLLGVQPANTLGYPKTHIWCRAAWGEVSV